MQRSSILFNLLGAVGLLGLLSGCSGGGGGATTGTGGTTSGTAAASGTITGFGSVYVNGKKFDTSGATFTVDGLPGLQTDLKLGMTVTVTGSFNGSQWIADNVLQKDAVEGLVQSIAPDRLSLVVMGQTVMVTSGTEIDERPIPTGLNRDIRNLAVGQFVEVNGHVRPNGVIQATYIEKKSVRVTPEVRGFVTGHVHGTETFQIGNLTVNYTGANISKMPDPTVNVWDGLFVELKELAPGAFDSGTQILTATRVAPEGQGLGGTVDEAEVEGFVTRIDGPRDFFIGTTHVQTAQAIDGIVVGARLSAEGRLANGSLTANQVKFQTIGFDGMVPGGIFGGIELGFTIAGNGGDFSIVGADGANHASSSSFSGSSFMVDLIGGEFTAQSLDLSSIGDNTTFVVVGLADRDDPGSELFHFTYLVSAGTDFERIFLADETRKLQSIYNFAFNGSNGKRLLYDVNLDKVERLVISAVYPKGVTARVDNVHVGQRGL